MKINVQGMKLKKIAVDRCRVPDAEGGSPDQAELYNLDADPKEFTNLVGDSQHPEVLARARLLLEKAQQHAKL